MATVSEQIQQIYIGLLGRAADQAGLDYWAAEINSGALTLEQLRANIVNEQPEYAAGQGSMTRAQAVADLYENLFNRQPEAAGLEYWVNGGGASVNIDQLVLALIAGASAADQLVLDNKTEVAEYYTAAAGADYTADAAKAAVDNVDATRGSVDAAKVAIDSGTVASGQTFTLTNSATADTIIGTSGNDTVNGPTGTVVNGDLIIDQTTTDNDTANLVLTTAYAPDNITNIENVNLDWDAFGTATYNLTNVKGAKNVTLTSQKVGFQGSANVTNVDGVTLTAGAGMTGTLTASGFKTGTVEGGSAKSLVIDGTATNADNASITVNAGAGTTSVSVGATNGFKAATVNAGTAATIAIGDAGNATDVTNLTVNANATITNTATGKVNLTANDGNSITMNVIGAALDVAGKGAITLNSTGLTTETVTNNVDGTLTVVSSATTAQDVSKVDASLIRFTGDVNGALTFKSGANAELTNATVTSATITGSSASGESVNLKASGAAITTLAAAANLETLNLTAAAPQVTGNDLTVGTLTLNSNKVVVSGTNDVSLASVTNAGTVDASALNGEFALTQTGSNILTVTGSATGKNTVTFAATTVASNYTGGNGDDTVVFAQTTGAGAASATAVLGDGKNTVTANALTDGDLVVIGGSGVDTVSAAAITDANVTLQLGDGNNVVTLGTAGNSALNAATINIVTGAGNDKVSILEATTANTEVNLTLGGGTNTLALAAADYSAGTWTTSGLNAIEMAGGGAATTVAASLVSGQTIHVSATATAGDIFTVAGTKATGETIDLSKLAMDQTITKAVISTAITGNAGNDTIIGTDLADTINGGGGNDIITGGKGADTIVLGAGVDKVIIGAGDTGKTTGTVDLISNFKAAGADTISFGLAATATNYAEAASTHTGSANATIEDVTAQANALLAGTVRFAVIDNAGDSAATNSYVFFDRDGDGTADEVITLVGKVLDDVAFADFVA